METGLSAGIFRADLPSWTLSTAWICVLVVGALLLIAAKVLFSLVVSRTEQLRLKINALNSKIDEIKGTQERLMAMVDQWVEKSGG